MSNDVHSLYPTASFPKFLLSEAIYFARLQILKPLECLIIAHVMWLRIKIFEQ